MLDSSTVECLRIEHIRRTPVLQLRYRNDLNRAQIFSKCENFSVLSTCAALATKCLGCISYAVPFGYHPEAPGVFKGQRIGVSINGGNDDLDTLLWTLG